MPRRLIAEATSRLKAAGVPSARVDAELLAAYVLDVPRGRLVLVDEFPPSLVARFEELVARRAERIPLQHLTGLADFAGLELAVGPGVFVPRPETELLVEWGLSKVRTGIAVDLCSGSGAIACAIARTVPVVYAVERDPDALPWLHRNTQNTSVTVVPGDATDPSTLAELDGTVDLLLTNPPYVPTTEALPPEVIDHDPAVALFGGADGLSVIRPLLVRAARLLRPGGWFGMEHDDQHGESVPELMRASGDWEEITAHRDLAGRPRFATGRRA
ncbi:peptide chain release factor N(5)-glutamine methyltransferase [Longispora sp. NPDC051575]|uniref:peptide chain release factor N(5)-glutamine methyltransferase n=1 Tax=Longispora sp. NPDC051575 TaxID=3154943 RepID=UPI0034492A05